MGFSSATQKSDNEGLCRPPHNSCHKNSQPITQTVHAKWIILRWHGNCVLSIVLSCMCACACVRASVCAHRRSFSVLSDFTSYFFCGGPCLRRSSIPPPPILTTPSSSSPATAPRSTPVPGPSPRTTPSAGASPKAAAVLLPSGWVGGGCQPFLKRMVF